MVFRLVGLPILAGLLGAALFAFMANHPDVYFWLIALPQHLVSTFLVTNLSAFGILRNVLETQLAAAQAVS